MANAGCGSPAAARASRIASLWVIRCAVSVPIPGRPSASRDRGDDRHRAIGGDRHDSVHFVLASDLGDGGDVREVDDLADVCREQPERALVAVDRDDVCPAVANPLDRTALVAPSADEEDGRHGRRC